MPFGTINYLAVLVGTLFNMVLGFLWYGPILGKVWLKEMEKAGRKIEDMKGTGGIYAVTLVAAFASSLGLALIIKAAGASGVGAGIGWGVLVWIAIGVMTTLTTVTFEGRRAGLWVLSGLYYLVVFAVQGALYTLWP